MVVADLMSILHATTKLAQSSSSQYSAFWYAFGSIAPAFPPALTNKFIAKKLLPRLCGSPCSRMSFGQQPYDNTLWLSFSWWMCMNQVFHVCVETRVQECGTLAMYAFCLILTCLLLPLTWKTLSMLARPRNHSSAPSFQLWTGSLPYAPEYSHWPHTFSHVESH